MNTSSEEILKFYDEEIAKGGSADSIIVRVVSNAIRRERKACALIAQSFEISPCKSHYDDAVDSTAELIKEAIADRGVSEL